MSLVHRLKRLEQRAAPPRPSDCVKCGLPLHRAKLKDPARVRVGWWSPGDPEKPPCPACGQKREFRIEFDKAG